MRIPATTSKDGLGVAALRTNRRGRMLQKEEQKQREATVVEDYQTTLSKRLDHCELVEACGVSWRGGCRVGDFRFISH